MIDYDEAVKTPGAFCYGWPKQRLQICDLRSDLESALNATYITKEKLDKEPNIDSKNLEIINKCLKIINTSLAEADDLALDLLVEVVSRHQAQSAG